MITADADGGPESARARVEQGIERQRSAWGDCRRRRYCPFCCRRCRRRRRYHCDYDHCYRHRHQGYYYCYYDYFDYYSHHQRRRAKASS